MSHILILKRGIHTIKTVAHPHISNFPKFLIFLIFFFFFFN